MRISRAAIKQNAKSIITTAKPNPILVGLAFLAVTYVLQFLSYTVSGQYQAYTKMMDQMMAGNLDYVPQLPHINAGGVAIIIAILLMLIMLGTGFTIYCMNVCQFRKAGFVNLLDGFAIFFKVLWLNILMLILIYLWTLLLIIPGIIAAYRYRMALYIMIDNPHMTALECITASKKMMTGRKGELFVLDLSFIGWYLLTLFPFVSIWVTPYTCVTYTNYYLARRDMPQSGIGQQFPNQAQ